jgi:RHS repeat-associated protein
VYAPYKFTGKESDPETDLTYFGARYYDAALGIWLGVDNLSYKYPNLSAYAYCANNPVIYRDLDGNDHIFYLVFQSGSKGVSDIVAKTQDLLTNNNINMKVMAIYADKNISTEMYKTSMDKTDALVFIGDQKFVDKRYGASSSYTINGGDSDEKVGYINRDGIAQRAKKQNANINLSIARSSLHEALGHVRTGEGHTNLDGISDNGMKKYGTKYQGEDSEFYNNIMSAGTKINLNSSTAYLFVPEDLAIIHNTQAFITKEFNINGIKITLCPNICPIDNLTVRLNNERP